MGRAGSWIAGHFLLLPLLLSGWGCVSPPPLPSAPPLRHPGPRAVRSALARLHQVVPLPWPVPGGKDWPALGELDLAVLDLRSRAFPEDALSQEACRAMARWVREGGSLLLLGYAPAWVEALGFEKRGPDRVYLFRHGVTDQAVRGTYLWGLQALPVRENHPLFQGLRPWRVGGSEYLLGGGAPVDLEIAGWRRIRPREGLPLGRLFRVKEGLAKSLSLEVFHLWRPGRGRILALGLGLSPGPKGSLPPNAALLLERMTSFLTGKDQGARVGWLRGRDPSLEWDDWVLPPPPPPPEKPWWTRPGPVFPSLAHWGVRARAAGWTPRKEPRSLEEILRVDLERLYRAGADYVELDPWDPSSGYPFPWPSADPLPPPPGWLGRARPGGWTFQGLRRAAARIHEIGFLAAPFFQEAPLRDWRGPGGAARLRRAATLLFRELFDRSLAGPAASLDGIVLGWWPAFGTGELQGLLWRYHPGAFVVQTAAPHRMTPSATRAVNAQFGRIRGIEAGGVARGWRWDDHPPLYLAMEADLRLLPAPGPDPGRIRAGRGAWPDWVAAQVQDFARERYGPGAALAFLGWEEGRAPRSLRAFAEGLMAFPLRGSLCFALSATGKDGWRAQARRWVPAAQEGFGASDGRPCSSISIQNGFLRLYGTGGNLLYDPSGRADFRGSRGALPPGRILSLSFFRTVVRSVAAVPSEVASWRVVRDAATRSFTGPGKWKASAWVSLDPSLPAAVPERLSLSGPPKWPRTLKILAGPPPGLYRFRLEGTALGGGGMIRLEAGGLPLAFRSYASRGEKVALQADVPKTKEGNFELDLVLESGADLLLERVSLERVGDTAVSSRILVPSGPRAVLEERLWSSYLRERRLVVAAQDTPGLVIQVETDKAARGCRVDREFILTGYDELLRGGKVTRTGALHGPVEGPWMLRDSKGVLPDLLVVLLERSAHLKLSWRPGFGLLLEDHPVGSERFSIGFYLPREGEIPRERRYLLRGPLLELLDPPKVRLGPALATKVKSPFAFPWARVVELVDPPPTPLLVEEGGWWSIRPASALPGGKKGAALVLYQRPGETSRIRGGRRRSLGGPAGRGPGGLVPPSLPGGWRPGRGSARLVALRPGRTHREAQVLVGRCGPLLFAPSVETGVEIGRVLLNGRDWSYFQGRTVFLPRRPGKYRIEIFPGSPAAPGLAAASASVERCSWDGASRTLSLRLAHPAWFRGPLPPRAPYTLLVRPAGRSVSALEGARLVPAESLARPAGDLPAARAAGLLFTAGPGEVKIRFQ